MADPLYPAAAPVLCPGLHSRLRDLFGEVLVSNRGEQMRMRTIKAAGGHVRTDIDSSGEYYRVNCPFCGDTRKRLWVNYRFGQLDGGGRPMKFLAVCYNDDCLKERANLQQLHMSLTALPHARSNSVFMLPGAEWSDITTVTPRMPGTCVPLSRLCSVDRRHPAVSYMLDTRRYSLPLLDKYGVSFCTDALPEFRPALNRIVFPIYFRNVFAGWQARYVGEADWKVILKYYTMPGLAKRQLLYNFDNASRSPFVVVVEGVTDCRSLGDYGVALLGKSVSPQQRNLLQTQWSGKPIIMLLDGDARAASEATVHDMRGDGTCVIDCELPEDKDPGDYEFDTLMAVICRSAAAVGVRLPV